MNIESHARAVWSQQRSPPRPRRATIARPAAAARHRCRRQSVLTRAPYLTDLTQTSVQVNWATSAQYTGVVQYGPPGNCTANSPSRRVPAPRHDRHREGLPEHGHGQRPAASPPTATGSPTPAPVPVDLLGSNPSPQFTTLEPANGTAPLTFDVLGDWGDTTNSGNTTTGAINQNQAGVDAQMAASGAQFVVSTGDVAYPGGTQADTATSTRPGTDVSAVFGPSYWAVPGESIPYFAISGNHGLNSTFITNWPESATAAASGGEYGMYPYPSIDGANAASYPTSYYAFSAGGARFYMLDAAWGDSNTGTATGGSCGSRCTAYQVDHDAHWTPPRPSTAGCSGPGGAPGRPQVRLLPLPAVHQQRHPGQRPLPGQPAGQQRQPRAAAEPERRQPGRSTATRTSTSGTSPRRAG